MEEKRKLEAKKLFQGSQHIMSSGASDKISEHTFNQIYTQHQQASSKPTSGPKAANAPNRRYHLDQNSQLTDLKMPRINLKFVSLNLFSKNLINVDLSENKIKSLPEEITTIITLQNLQIEQNLIECLPRDLWKLANLQKLIASQNQLKELPPNFEWLYSLEFLQLNDNLITKLPEKFGLLSNLKKLHLHENRLASLPRDLSKLVNLIDFSIEWFMYTKPANSRVQKNPDVIKSVRDFCQNFQFNPAQQLISGGISKTSSKFQFPSSDDENQSIQAVKRPQQVSMHQETNPLFEDKASSKQQLEQQNYVTFTDFIIQYHKIPHSDLSLVNKIEFTMKKRSLAHQLCFNIHTHLIRSLLNMPAEGDTGDGGRDPELFGNYSSSQLAAHHYYGLQKPLVMTPKSTSRGDLKQQKSSSNLHDQQDSSKSNTAQAVISKVINLNKKDTQNVVPLCLLVMNMTPFEKLKESSSRPKRDPFSGIGGDLKEIEQKNFAKTAANFFAQDQNQDKSKLQNKKRKEMMRLLLSARDEQGEPLVDINNDSRRKGGDKNKNNGALIPQEQRQSSQASGGSHQHPIIYWAVFKYQFKLAIEFIRDHGADPTVLNSNNSNLLHIVFANFKHDVKYASKLATLLIERKVHLNLVDKDHKSPLLVAIKKSQIEAIEYAHHHNIRKHLALMRDSSFINASNLIKKNICQLELFDFQMRGRVQLSPLHYVIKKSNYDAFMYLVQYQLCDYLHRNSDQITPRLMALINSAFYRILLKEEKWQIRRQIAMLELSHVQQQNQEAKVVPERSLLGFLLTRPAILCNQNFLESENQQKLGPGARAFVVGGAGQMDELALMKKDLSETTVRQIYETNANAPCLSSRINHLDFSLLAPQSGRGESNDKYFSGQQPQKPNYAFTGTNRERREITDLGIADLSSIASPRITFPMAFTIQKQEAFIQQAMISARKQITENSERHTEVIPENIIQDIDLLRKRSQALKQLQYNPDIKNDKQKLVDLEIEYDQLNYVCHYVYSRRSIIMQNDDVQVEIVDNFESDNLTGSVLFQNVEEVEQVKRPNRSSTLRLSDKDNFEFTLGHKKNPRLQQNVFKLSASLGGKPATKALKQVRIKADSHQHMPYKVLERDVQSPQSPSTDYFAGEPTDEPTTVLFTNGGEDQATTRVLQIDSNRHKQTSNQQNIGNLMPSTKFKQFNMFRSIKNRNNLSPQLKDGDSKATGAIRLYEQRALEMQKPPSVKRLALESPDKILRRQESDVSIPPSYRINEESHQQMNYQDDTRKIQKSLCLRDIKQNLQQCTDLVIDTEDDFGQAIDEIELDEILRETTPNRILELQAQNQAVQNSTNTTASNLFAQAGKDEHFDTVRALEGPQRPSNTAMSAFPDRDIPQSQQNYIWSPHFNEATRELEESKQPKHFAFNYQRPEGTEKYSLPQSALSPNTSTMGYMLPNVANIEQQAAAERGSMIQNTQTAETGNNSNIFISNMNININLNITVNYPSEKSEHKDSLPETERDQQQNQAVVGGGSNKLQQTSSQEHQLSTIQDEEQLNESREHQKKLSMGTKTPVVLPDSIAVESEQTSMADQIRSTTLNSIIESQAKAKILNQINPSEIVQAVSQHIQNRHHHSASLQATAEGSSRVATNKEFLQQHSTLQQEQTTGQHQMPQRPLFSSCDIVGESFDDSSNAAASVSKAGHQFRASNDLQMRLSHQAPTHNIKDMMSNGSLMSASPPLDEQKMFTANRATSVNNNLPIEKRRFQTSQRHPNNIANLQQQSLSNNSCSENIGTSIIGTTPSKPQFEQSVLKDKQGRRQEHDLPMWGGMSNPALNREYRSLEAMNDDHSPKFNNKPQNDLELFSGRLNVKEGNEQLDYRLKNPLTTAMGDSTNKTERQNEVLGYLLTENYQNQQQSKKEGDNTGNQKVNTMLSGSQDQKSYAGVIMPNTYTLGNIRLDDQQVTLPSMTQQSNIVMNTGLSEMAVMSPNDPRHKVNDTVQPRVNFANTQLVQNKMLSSMSRMQLHHDSVPVGIKQGDEESPLSPNTEFISTCERQLSQNKFLNEFRTLCNKNVPDWFKYQIVYNKLALHLQVNGTSKTAVMESQEKRDAMLCLELLVEVLTVEPSALLQDLIHIVSKSNMMRARNDIIDSVCTSITRKCDQIAEGRELIGTIEENINVYKRVAFESQTTILSSYCYASSSNEIKNARIIHEVYKKIQLNKFPTISKNLGLFLKNKRQNEQSNVHIISKEEIRRTQNIPQSLQKRVKISMNDRPQMVEEPLNENIFTPRDPINSNRPQSIKPNPDQSVPQSHPTKLASQMALLNEVSNANRPGFHAKLQNRLAESVVYSTSSKSSGFFARKHDSEADGISINANGLSVSREAPSKIQPIRNIVSPKGFFPQSK